MLRRWKPGNGAKFAIWLRNSAVVSSGFVQSWEIHANIPLSLCLGAVGDYALVRPCGWVLGSSWYRLLPLLQPYICMISTSIKT